VPAPWLVHLPGAPTVYATLGTVFNLESGDLFERLLEGLGKLDANVIATVGSQIDPAELGEVPANVHVERYLPQALVLPYCDAVVSHGGSGTVLGALAHGLPMVLLPMGADQPLNAARCEELGIARVIDAPEATGAAIREAADFVLTDPGYRLRATRFADELASLPGPEEAVALLSRLR
jgi:MGT family glycosyltransferase